MIGNDLMKRKIITDVLLSMIATFIPMFALQFLILPQVALRTSAEVYGQVITIVALMNLSASSFGSVMNNTRLIRFKEYEILKIQGDFNILLLIAVIGNILVMVAGLFYYGQSLSFFILATVVINSILMVLSSYASVEFRIKLNYKNILLNNVLLFFGYLIGYFVFLITGYWVVIYLFGLGFSILFILIKTNILREPFKKTHLFKVTTTQTSILFVSGILVALSAYVDKLIIFPLLGGAEVSIYYTATILGKTIALAVGPITGVLLSYLAHMNQFSNHNFKLLIVISTVVGIIGFWFVMLVSEPILTIVYPQYVGEALKYIHITTLSIIITIIGNVINSVLLKFVNVKWQIIINGIYMTVYIPVSMLLLSMYGLMGFCVGILIASIIRLLIMILAYYFNNKTA